MVHNGIEYGDMQLICESYHLMKDVLGMTQDEMAQVSHKLLRKKVGLWGFRPGLTQTGLYSYRKSKDA